MIQINLYSNGYQVLNSADHYNCTVTFIPRMPKICIYKEVDIFTIHGLPDNTSYLGLFANIICTKVVLNCMISFDNQVFYALLDIMKTLKVIIEWDITNLVDFINLNKYAKHIIIIKPDIPDLLPEHCTNKKLICFVKSQNILDCAKSICISTEYIRKLCFANKKCDVLFMEYCPDIYYILDNTSPNILSLRIRGIMPQYELIKLIYYLSGYNILSLELTFDYIEDGELDISYLFENKNIQYLRVTAKATILYLDELIIENQNLVFFSLGSQTSDLIKRIVDRNRIFKEQTNIIHSAA